MSDSGEGRWTSIAAIDVGAPAQVLTTALYERFTSRGEADFADRVLSAMRFGFGGHVEARAEGHMAVAEVRSATRTDGRSDGFVFFGATGDLAFKQIFPALAGLIRDEGFDLPIVGVARSGDLASLREAAWRAADGVFRARARPHAYEPGTWGPPEAATVLLRGDRWHDPAAVPGPPAEPDKRSRRPGRRTPRSITSSRL